MLGTTVPEPNSDGRVLVCSAGVSPELNSLVRVYPLARKAVPRRWGQFRVPLQRNPKDSRAESWRVNANRDPNSHWAINGVFEDVQPSYPERLRQDLLKPFVMESIEDANQRRLSLAIIEPRDAVAYLQPNSQAAPDEQLTLFDDGADTQLTGAKRFPWMPRIKFSDGGGQHDLMLRDWGVFELQRKNTEAYFCENFAGALHLGEGSALLVGNMNNRRRAWLVISILNGLHNEPTLF